MPERKRLAVVIPDRFFSPSGFESLIADMKEDLAGTDVRIIEAEALKTKTVFLSTTMEETGVSDFLESVLPGCHWEWVEKKSQSET